MILNAITGLATDISTSSTGAVTSMLALGIVVVAAVVLIGIGAYIYMSLALMATARRLRTEPAWLAWIPIANLYLQAKIVKKSAWPLWLLLSWILALLIFVNPLIGFIGIGIAVICSIVVSVFAYIWLWKICEARGKPGWWAILSLIAAGAGLIPILGVLISLAGTVWGFVMWGILAWGK
jgi:hypothetical protein